MDPLLKASWAGSISKQFTAVEILLPDASLRLVDGGFVVFDVDGIPQTFTSRDVTFGTLGAVDTISDGVEEAAISAAVTLSPPTDGALAKLAAPGAQGSQVRIWQGAVDPATGLSIGAPERLFIGSLDVPNLKLDQRSRLVILQCGSDDELQLEPSAQQKLSHSFHSSVWPGELGLIHIPRVADKVWWRLDEPQQSVSRGGGGNGGGGGSISNPGIVIR